MSHKLENELIQIIESDEWMINILKVVKGLNLNDYWIGAGFVRNKVWDEKHGKERSKLNDIDVIYFDKSSLTKENDLKIESKLRKLKPNLSWSVKNQSRMHIRNGHKQYTNCYEAISFWPETSTSIAVKLNTKNKIEYIAPYGLDDLFNLIVKPTPNFDLSVYKSRIQQKKWREKWSKLKIRTNSVTL